MKSEATTTPNHRLRQERELRGWSQQELAERIDAPSSFYISRWERGKATPSPYYREKMCVLFEKNAVELGILAEPAAPVETSDDASAPLWSVPQRRNPFFTGRESLLETMHTLLRAERTMEVAQGISLHGLGGIGKTQVAVEYAYRYAQEYRAVFWLAAQTTESLMVSLQHIADQLQLPERQVAVQSRMVTALQRWLTIHSGWLLIADDVEDLELLQTVLPPMRQGALLLTTRRQALGTLAEPLRLFPLSREEGIMLVLHRAKQSCMPVIPQDMSTVLLDAPGAVELVTLLEGLPLALDQAGAYIEETGCSLENYIRRYHDHREQLLARRGIHCGAHPDSVAATLKLSIERIEQEQPVAGELLRLYAFLSPEGIPEELLVAGASHLEPRLRSVVVDPYQFDLALASLRSASLVTRHPETHTLSLHRLLQAVLQDQMDAACVSEWSQTVVRIVNAAFPEGTLETWEHCERYLAQVLACVPLIERVASDLPEAGELLYRAGSYLLERGRYQEAESLLARSIALGEEQPGCDQKVLLSRLKKQEELFWHQGKYALAEDLFRRILALVEQHLEPGHLLISETFANLAFLYREQGRCEEAKRLCLQALSMQSQDQQQASESKGLAIILNVLAILYMDAGKYAQAEELFQRAVHIWAQLGPEHPHTARVFSNLAVLQMLEGRYDEAESFVQRALHIQERLLGPEHPQIAFALSNLAAVYEGQEKYALAETVFLRVLNIRERRLEVDHPDIAFSLTKLANLYRDQGKYEQAEQYYLRALAIGEQRLGPEHHRMVKMRQDYDSLLEQRRKCLEC